MIKLIILILTTVFSVPTLANTQCADLFSSSAPINQTQLDATDNLIAYLGELLGEQIIGDRELNRFIDGLENNTLVNPISESESKIHTQAQIQRGGIQEHLDNSYLDKNNLSKERLLEWALKSLKEKKRVREKRGETRQETKKIPYRKMEFLPVQPGWGCMLRGQGKNTQEAHVKLTHHIEVMATQVTQAQWVKVMGENPSYFAKGEDKSVINVNGKPIKLQPDNPVENVTWWSVVMFANKLSEKQSLKPAYDLSEITWKQGTGAENGTLQAESGEIKINARGEDYYEAEGFRLPTEAEQHYLLLTREKDGRYQIRDIERYLIAHAWYSKNAHRKTHPVGEKSPLIIDGKEFFDLYGNVLEWAWDRFDYGDPFLGGENPAGPESGDGRVATGGSYGSSSNYIEAGIWTEILPNKRRGGLGFRLVRTTDVKPETDAPSPEVTE